MQPQVDLDEATVGLKAPADCDLNVAFHTWTYLTRLI